MVLFCTGNEQAGIIEQACSTRTTNARTCVWITCHQFCTDFQTLSRLRPKSCTYHQYRHNTRNGNAVKVHDVIANSDTRIPPSNPARGRDIGCSLFFLNPLSDIGIGPEMSRSLVPWYQPCIIQATANSTERVSHRHVITLLKSCSALGTFTF